MTEVKTLEYYFDFASPYGYLGTVFVEELAASIGRKLIWKPYLMGAAMKVTKVPLLTEVPLKQDYMTLDLDRWGKNLGVPIKKPENFPFMSVSACRAYYSLLDDDPGLAARWCKHTARKGWGQGKDLSDMQVLMEIATELGVDFAQLTADIQEKKVKDRLYDETQRAIERGLWGSPHFIVDDTDFYWGCDKRHEIAATYGSNNRID